jgi:hypothetical protein
MFQLAGLTIDGAGNLYGTTVVKQHCIYEPRAFMQR